MTNRTSPMILDDAGLDGVAAGRGGWGLVIKEWETASTSVSASAPDGGPRGQVSLGHTEIERTY